MALGTRIGQRAAKVATPQPPKPKPLSRHWLLAAVLINLAGLAAFATTTWLDLGEQRARREQHLQELVTSLADTLSQHKTQLREQLEQLAADQRLHTALEYADQANFATETARLKQRAPSALYLHLIRLEHGAAGIRILDEERLPLSYAGLDLVRRVASSGKISPLEAHQVGSSEAHLAIAGPIPGSAGRAPLGVIYLALPLELLPTPHPLVARGRHFLYQQGTGQSRATIVPRSAPAPAADAVRASAPIPETNIELIAWQPAPALFDAGPPWPMLIGAGTLIALNLLILFALATAQSRQVQREVGQLTAGLAQLDLGQPQSKRDLRLAELMVLDEALRHLARKQASHNQLRQSRQSLPEDAGLDLGDLPSDPDAPTEANLSLDKLDPPSRSASSPSAMLPDAASGSASGLASGTAESAAMVRVDVTKILGTIPARIFRPYDIRGLADTELSDELIHLLGRAIGTESQLNGSRAVLIGRDHRASGERLGKGLGEGLRASGCDVIDLGIVPTPVLYFATRLAGDISGAMLTASHNPTEYNGVKLAFSGKSATALNVAKLKQRLQRGEFSQGEGSYREQSVLTDYFDEVEQNIHFARPLKLAIDCGFATPALVAPQLFRELGCEVIEVRCDLNDPSAGTLAPDPSAPEHLRELIDTVVAVGADLGLGFDGDGDRLGVVDSAGNLIATDRVLMLLAGDILARAPGSEVVFDVKCSRLLAAHISSLGGQPLMWKSGHAFIKEKREEVKAPLAGEYSGHIVFGDRWNGFDDAFYAAARLIEVLALDPRPSQEIFAELPSAIATPELIARVAPGQELEIMSQVMETKNRLSGVKIITIDGLRVESDKGWALVRASNSEPALAFRFEAMNESTLEKLKDLFRRVMQNAAPDLKLPF